MGGSAIPITDERKKEYDYVLKNLFAGGCAGSVAKTITAPLDRVKILFQSRSPHYPPENGVFRTLVKINAKEGPTALFKGNAIQIARVFPYAAIQFAAFERAKLFYRNVPLLGDSPVATRLVSGSTAGVISVLATFPLDLARARFAAQVESKYYSGLIDCLKKVVRDEGGPKALYRGMAPTFWGIMPYAGLSFMTFESLKDMTKNTAMSRNLHDSVVNMTCGAVAGVVAQTATYPLDVLRRRQQLGGMVDKIDQEAQTNVRRAKTTQKSFGMGATVRVLIKMHKEEGAMSLWRGLSINYLRVVPSMAASFTVYGFMKKTLEIA